MVARSWLLDGRILRAGLEGARGVMCVFRLGGCGGRFHDHTYTVDRFGRLSNVVRELEKISKSYQLSGKGKYFRFERTVLLGVPGAFSGSP